MNAKNANKNRKKMAKSHGALWLSASIRVYWRSFADEWLLSDPAAP
jgi:hypothetical protein